LRKGIHINIFDFEEKKDIRFTNDEQEVRYPAFSHDGQWLAFCAAENEARWLEVYIRPSSGTGETLKVSREGGRAPVWSRNENKLFYRSLDNTQMWVVDIKTEGGLAASSPRMLFEKEGLWDGEPIRSYDISLDDKEFLMVKLEDRKPQPVTEMILIQNWFEELKRLVPTGK
jgi:Tol biopolymer transport system component